MDNVLVTVLRQIAKGNVNVFDYRRDREHFLNLWGLSGSENEVNAIAADAEKMLKELSGMRKILLIEASDISVIPTDVFGKHVGALQWALIVQNALALNYLSVSVPEIAILDISSSTKANKEIRNGICYFTCDPQDLDNLVNWMLIAPQETQLSGDICEHVQAWKIGLALSNTRNDHHYLNNLLGPIALAAGVKKSDEVRKAVLECHATEQRTAAAALMRALELGSAGSTCGPAVKALSLEKMGSRERELRILILDDQINEGWIPIFSFLFDLNLVHDGQFSTENQFSCCAERRVGDKRVLSLWIATTPDAILGKLRNGPLPCGLLFTNAAVEDDFDEILLLDLRLHSNHQESETRFLDEVDKLLYPQRSEEWDGHAAETNAYLEKLTGLARLISSIDYSYPVVVWSSTGQRRVVEALKKCHNVYTGLEKPRFDAYSSGVAINDLASDLSRAIDFSLRLLNGRYWLQRINKFVAAIPSTDHEPDGSDVTRIEIYIDERTIDKEIDSAKPLWLGGIALIYSGNNLRETVDMAKRLDDLMTKTSVMIGREERKLEFTERDDKLHLRKEARLHHSESIWKSFVDCVDKVGGRVLSFAIRCPNSIEIFYPKSHLDSRYYKTMPSLVESIISVTASSFPTAEGRIALIAGNRVKPTFMNKTVWETEFCPNWALTTYPNIRNKELPEDKRHYWYYSIGDQWMHAVASLVSLPSNWKVDAATAPQLSKLNKNDIYRQSQFIPDMLLAQLYRENEVSKKLHLELMDAAFESALQAWRFAKEEALQDALVAAKHTVKELEKRLSTDKDKSALTGALLRMTMIYCYKSLNSSLFSEFSRRIED